MGYKPGIMNIQKYDGEAEGYKAEGGEIGLSFGGHDYFP